MASRPKSSPTPSRVKPGETNPVKETSVGENGSYNISFADGRKFVLEIAPGDEGRVRVIEKGGAGREAVAGESPLPLPTEVFKRIQQTASAEDYGRLRKRLRKGEE